MLKGIPQQKPGFAMKVRRCGDKSPQYGSFENRQQEREIVKLFDVT